MFIAAAACATWWVLGNKRPAKRSRREKYVLCHRIFLVTGFSGTQQVRFTPDALGDLVFDLRTVPVIPPSARCNSCLLKEAVFADTAKVRVPSKHSKVLGTCALTVLHSLSRSSHGTLLLVEHKSLVD